MSDRGIKITITLYNKEKVNGWLYNESPLGILISLDDFGKDIRFIREGQYQTILYHREEKRAHFDNEIINEDTENTSLIFDDNFQESMVSALDRMDYNRLKRISGKIGDNRERLKRYITIDKFHYETDLEEVADLRDLQTDVLSVQSELHDEIHRSGLDDILLLNKEKIRQIISIHTTPSIDASILSVGQLTDQISRAKAVDFLSKETLRKENIDSIKRDNIMRIERENRELIKEKIENPKTYGNFARNIKLISSFGKIAIGGALTVADLALGTLVGFPLSLPTLGLGTVPAIVGIATSAYTGLNTSCEGLKDLASNSERK